MGTKEKTEELHVEYHKSPMRGYKVFDNKWRGFNLYQFKVGGTFTHEGKLALYNSGFHFCETVIDALTYKALRPDCKYAEVEAIGEILTDGILYVTNKIKVVREISFSDVLREVNYGAYNYGIGNVGTHNIGDGNIGSYNRGCYNSGDYNIGHNNSGFGNIGAYNTGAGNVGCYNAGSHNVGSRNSGSWNFANNCTGFFNTHDGSTGWFDKPFQRSENEATVPSVLRVTNTTLWKWHGDLDKRTREYKDHRAIEVGGWLFDNSRDAVKSAVDAVRHTKDWPDVRESILSMPNFDPEIFHAITRVSPEDLEL